MPVISRRLSLFLLSFAVFFLITPTLFSQTAGAQEASWLDSKTLVPAATQGGIGVILLIFFIIQSKKDQKKSEETTQLVTAQIKSSQEAATAANDTTKLAFEKYNEHTNQLIQLLKDEQEYKTELRGTLERILVESGIPAKCPILIGGRKFSIEVKE